jgi:hypothetical protein
MRLFLIFVITALLLAGCGDGLFGDEDPTPTILVITSTPDQEDAGTTEPPAESPVPTGTEEQGSANPTATDVPVEPTAEEPAETTTEEDAEQPSDDELLATIEQIEQETADLRGLELLEEINKQIMTRAELRANVEEIIDEEYTPEVAQDEALALWLLRLIEDRNLDLYQLQIDLLGEQIAGYYDPETKELVVISDDGGLSAVDKVTMSHEVVHALQDQHFDLAAVDSLATNADQEFAITSLIEGDATTGMSLYMFEYLPPDELADVFSDSLAAPDTPVYDNAPRYIREGLVFPYESGGEFVNAIFSQGDFEAVNEAFANPPMSTEQILHPEKYLQELDEPAPVELPDIAGQLGEGWEGIYGDVLGEWDLRIMLDENGARDADAAAAGWDGSWFDVYKSGDQAISVMRTVWDTDDDATEFNDALMQTFEGYEQAGDLWSGEGRFFGVATNGTTVTLVSGTDQDAVTAAMAAVQ